jgi:heterotetrameric sarcosine oxidase gamma subunit
VGDVVVLREVTIRAAWNVQGRPQRLGIAVPTAPNTVGRVGDAPAFWLGPRSWLVLGERIEVADGAAFDVSASRVAFELAGPRATDVLAGHCPLDFHASAFAHGTCAQSLFGQVNALYYRHASRDAFTVFVARSFGRDVAHHLRASAAAEFATSCPFVAD